MGDVSLYLHYGTHGSYNVEHAYTINDLKLHGDCM